MRKLLISAVLCLVTSAAMAQFTLERLFIHVELHQDGSATVTETRQANIGNQGTEGYITFKNMGDIEVRDLQVFDDQKNAYVTEEKWDVDRSRAEKTGRCGYHNIDDGVEVCWGIGDAGERKYVIRYTLTNLVKAYEDYDGFCHSFYEAANAPAQKALVAISVEDDSLSRAKAAIWTFGYHGTKGFTDGMCYAAPDSIMYDGESIIVLLQLEKGVLDPAVKKQEFFSETVKRRALEGSDYNLEDAGLGDNVSTQKTRDARKAALAQTSNDDDDDWDDEDSSLTILYFLLFIGGIAIVGIIIYIIIDMFLRKRRFKALFRKFFDGDKYDDLPYYRDLPLNGNLLLSGITLGTLEDYAKYIGYKTFGGKFGLQQIYDAFILRMFYKKNIQLELEEADGETRKLFRINEPVKPEAGADVLEHMENQGITLPELNSNEAHTLKETEAAEQKYRGYVNDTGLEYYLQKLLYDAAGEDHLLQPDELKEFVQENPLEWRPFSIILRDLTYYTLKEKELCKGDVYQVVGFLHYLRDFSLVAERNIEETNLWKEYLVYASLYGIAEQVRKDMKKIAPDAARLDELVPAEELVNDFEPLATALVETIIYAHAYQTEAEEQEIYERHHSADDSGGDSGRSSYSGGGGHSGGGGSGFR